MAESEKRWVELEMEVDDRTTIRPEIDDDSQIVRYVRLSTLFLYLTGRAFIPSLLLLRRMDDLEGRLALEFRLPKMKEHFDALIKPFAVIGQQPSWIGTEMRERLDFAERSRWWFHELAKRRATWCWNIYDGPSNAMLKDSLTRQVGRSFTGSLTLTVSGLICAQTASSSLIGDP